jgi:hypothetical protein
MPWAFVKAGHLDFNFHMPWAFVKAGHLDFNFHMPWAFVKTGAQNDAPTNSLYQSLPICWKGSVQHHAKVFSCQVSIYFLW